MRLGSWRAVLRSKSLFVGLLVYSLISLGFLLGELRFLQFPFSLWNTADVLRREIGVHILEIVILAWSSTWVRRPWARAVHGVAWWAYIVRGLCVGFGFFSFAGLAAVDLDRYLMEHFFSYGAILERIPILGIRPDIVFLAPLLTPLLFPIIYRWARRHPLEPTTVRPRAFLTSLVLGALLVVVPSTARYDGTSSPFLLRLFSSPGRPEIAVSKTEDWPSQSDGLPGLREGIQGSRFRHVAVIVLESTGASATTVYEPELATTPFLADLAERSVLFERAYTSIGHTSKAFVAMMCGIWPYPHMEVVEQEPRALPVRCLPEILSNLGFDTVYFSSAEASFEGIGKLVERFGFEESYPVSELQKGKFEPVNYFGYEDDIMLPPARTWLGKHAEKSTLAVYFTNTPHHDFVVPGSIDYVDFGVEREHNNYLNTVRYVDRFTKKVFGLYEDLNLYEKTLFVVVGDHGEAFGEHFRRNHDAVPYEETIRIPLIVHSARMEPERRPDLVSQMAIPATVVDLLGYSPESLFEAPSLFDRGPEEIHTLCWYEYRCMTSVGTSLKVIDHFGRHLPESYELSEDPLERRKLVLGEAGERELAAAREWYAELDLRWKRHLESVGVSPVR